MVRVSYRRVHPHLLSGRVSTAVMADESSIDRQAKTGDESIAVSRGIFSLSVSQAGLEYPVEFDFGLF